MKKYFISIVCLMFAAMILASVAEAQDSDMKKHEEQWEKFNTEVIKAHQDGRYKEGILLAEKAYQYALKNLDKEHPYTLQSLNNLAFLYQSQGRYREAEPLFKETLQIREKVLGKEHPDTLISLNNLAGLYMSQSRYGEAEPLFKEALQIFQKVLGKEHPNTLYSLNNLAELYKFQGRYREAEPLFKEALQIFQKVLGKEHPGILQSLNNLAGLHKLQGRYGEAELLFKEALQIGEKVLGQEHPYTLTYLNNLAVLYVSQYRYDEAEPLYKKALQLREKVLGKEHPDTLVSLNNLADLYVSQYRYGEAESLYKKALQLREKVLGKEHLNTLYSLNNLALLYQSQERYGEAEPLHKEILQLFEKVLGKEHPDTLTSLNNLALLYKSQERYEEAEPLYKEALQLREKVLGREHPATLKIQLNYIYLLINMKKSADAFRLLKNMENQLFARSFQELYTTSQDRVRRVYLEKISNFQDAAFSFSLKYPEAEHQRFAANVMLRWKQAYSEESVFQHRFMNISDVPEVAQLKDKLAKLRADFSRQMFHPTLGKNLSEIWQDLISTEKAVREKAKVFKTDLQISKIDTDQVVHSLPKNSALIEFHMFNETDFKTDKLGKLRWAAYILLPNIDSGYQLFFEDLGEVADFTNTLSEAKDKYASLYQLFFSKFDKHIKDVKTLYIAPDGFLNLIPFAALKLPDGRYFAERQQINQLQTGRDLLASSSQKPSDVLIAVGGIDFGKSPDRKLSDKKGSAKKPDDIPKLNMRSGDELGGFASLPNSRKEAAAIAGLYESYNSNGKAILLNDGKTTEGYLKQIVQSPRILHLSTHGFYLESKSKEQWAEEEPLLLSGLALADANQGLAGITDDRGDDGLLYAIEVTGLNLQGTELVSLSACDTGKGVVDYSEGVYGLVRAFRTAGAQNVLMTLSPVGDEASREFMSRFYEFLLSSNLTPADAMHRTRLHFIRENRKPEFWSPYVLVGK